MQVKFRLGVCDHWRLCQFWRGNGHFHEFRSSSLSAEAISLAIAFHRSGVVRIVSMLLSKKSHRHSGVLTVQMLHLTSFEPIGIVDTRTTSTAAEIKKNLVASATHKTWKEMLPQILMVQYEEGSLINDE